MTLDTSDQNIYQAIGVEPIINCRGTFTIIGGSVELPEVVAAMEAASAISSNTTNSPMPSAKGWLNHWGRLGADSGGLRRWPQAHHGGLASPAAIPKS